MDNKSYMLGKLDVAKGVLEAVLSSRAVYVSGTVGYEKLETAIDALAFIKEDLLS